MTARPLSAETLASLDAWWEEVFGDSPLWTGYKVREHSGRLAGYEGVYAARKDDSVEISLPADTPPQIAEALRGAGIPAQRRGPIGDRTWWERVAPGWEVAGPARHYYLDSAEHLPRPEGVEEIELTEAIRSSLRALTEPGEWREAGLDAASAAAFAVMDEAGPVAVAALGGFRDTQADVRVLVRPDSRGHGFGYAVAAAAARHAVENEGIARWRCLESNLGSLALARRLGFHWWCSQIAAGPLVTSG